MGKETTPPTAARRILRHWLRTQELRGLSTGRALLWQLPKRGVAHGVRACVHSIHAMDLERWHRKDYRRAILEALGASSAIPHVVVVVPHLLHLLVPCLHLALRHVRVVLVLNGTRRWEQQFLEEAFPKVSILRLRTLPGTVMPHGQALELLLRHADRDIVLHDPDLFVFDPRVYDETEAREGELAAGPYGYTNRRSGLTFLTTPLLALRVSAVRELMERHRIGPELARRTPARLATLLGRLGIGDHNFPKEQASYYDALDLIQATGIAEGYRLRTFPTHDREAFHIGGVSYLEGNYRLDYLHHRLLSLPSAAPFAERLRPRLARRSEEELRVRFTAMGDRSLEQIDGFVEHLAERLDGAPAGSA